MTRHAKDRAGIDAQLAALDALPSERNAKIGVLPRALSDRHYRVAAKAARVAEEALLYELVPQLLAPLMEAWDGVLVGDELRRVLLRAAAAHRSEAAFDWLLAIVADGRLAVAREVVDALALYRHNAKLKERLEAALHERGEPQLREHFAKSWC